MTTFFSQTFFQKLFSLTLFTNFFSSAFFDAERKGKEKERVAEEICGREESAVFSHGGGRGLRGDGKVVKLVVKIGTSAKVK